MIDFRLILFLLQCTFCHYLYVATGIRFAKAISKQPKAQNQNRLSSDYIVIANSNDADIESAVLTRRKTLWDTELEVVDDFVEPSMQQSANDGNNLVVEGTGIDGDDEELCIEPLNDDNHRSAKRAPSRRGSAIPLISNFDETEI